MRNLFKLLVIAIIALSLTACGNTRQITNIEYVGINDDSITFLQDDGKKLIFYGEDWQVEHLVSGQKYTVIYYFDNAVEDDYFVDKIVLNEDASEDRYDNN